MSKLNEHLDFGKKILYNMCKDNSLDAESVKALNVAIEVFEDILEKD